MRKKKMSRRTWYRKIYLRSTHWKNMRKITLLSQGKVCKLCGSMKKLHIHHLSYERLGRELQSDLIVVCSTCHKKLHK